MSCFAKIGGLLKVTPQLYSTTILNLETKINHMTFDKYDSMSNLMIILWFIVKTNHRLRKLVKLKIGLVLFSKLKKFWNKIYETNDIIWVIFKKS